VPFSRVSSAARRIGGRVMVAIAFAPRNRIP
jgi:hypothetical protein